MREVNQPVKNLSIYRLERAKDYSKFLKSGEIKKVVYIPGKLVNVVG